MAVVGCWYELLLSAGAIFSWLFEQERALLRSRILTGVITWVACWTLYKVSSCALGVLPDCRCSWHSDTFLALCFITPIVPQPPTTSYSLCGWHGSLLQYKIHTPQLSPALHRLTRRIPPGNFIPFLHFAFKLLTLYSLSFCGTPQGPSLIPSLTFSNGYRYTETG